MKIVSPWNIGLIVHVLMNN